MIRALLSSYVWSGGSPSSATAAAKDYIIIENVKHVSHGGLDSPFPRVRCHIIKMQLFYNSLALSMSCHKYIQFPNRFSIQDTPLRTLA